jgi:hypothetical protein
MELQLELLTIYSPERGLLAVPFPLTQNFVVMRFALCECVGVCLKSVGVWAMPGPVCLCR